MLNTRHIVTISASLTDLSGIGEEWLLDRAGQNIVAVFIDGNFKSDSVLTTDDDDTVIIQGRSDI